MSVVISTLTLDGALLEGENPLPMFRNRDHHTKVGDNGTLTPELRQQLGEHTGGRYLPYRMQDRYTRERKPMVMKSIVLENDILKAVFLPEYGGRLYSLKDKRTNKDILYTNPVFQPANLAILNAWFSGGIEWNVGQVGHTFTTASPVHAAKLMDDNGNEFLRIYEYERCKNIFWHIDFHLPQGAKELSVYVRIINDSKASVPMYYWTNIAAPETLQSRVFSSTSKVIYIDHQVMGFGLGDLPELPSVPNEDSSYPMRIPFSNEYFFQTEADYKSPWEAIAYEDGSLFYERSTSLLRYRKLFCWGNHAGGRRWCDFLAKPGEGNYVEIQAGLAPTQMHGLDMPANSIWDFTQIFGVTQVDAHKANQRDWSEARDFIETQVNEQLQEDEVYILHEKLQAYANLTPSELLHSGSGWGALEDIRRKAHAERSIPDGFLFLESSIAAPQLPWLGLLQEGGLPEGDVQDIPASWMVQEEWMELLRTSLEHADNQTWDSYLHYGTMLYEHGLEDQAVTAWHQSLELKPSAWVYRNLAITSEQRGEADQALVYYELAYSLYNGFPDRAFADEYISMLIRNKQFAKAWSVYESLPEEFRQSDRLQIIIGAAAQELDHNEFLLNLFQKEFAVIREGEVTIVELWYKYQAKKLAESRNTVLSEELMKEAITLNPPPNNIDFRIVGA